MSSTYSTNLAIELIGSGEQAGNWGSTTNTNLGTLIEQAISGYTTYSCTGGTDTLTMTNGADATARNMYIQLSGTGGGSLVVPGTYPNANKKLYFIYNSTSSAITVKVSGQTGVSVPASAKIALVCNGSDIVTAENYMVSATLPNATLASPTMTGTPTAPTAAVGTSTTQVATTQFVQQAGLTGEVKMWATGTAPSGYLFCNGQSVSTTTYAALFAVIAYTYGGSGGSFNVPDFSGRMPIGVNGTYALASTGGAASTTLAEANLPAHNHAATSTVTDPGHSHTYQAQDAGTGGGGGGYSMSRLNANAGTNITGFAPGSINTNTTGITVATTTANTGSGTSFTNLPPYLGIYYIIKT